MLISFLQSAVRRATIALKFSPVFLGSALANKSVQSVLDGVCLYLPTPEQAPALALSTTSPTSPPQTLTPTANAPLVSLAFKLEEGKYGQLTYVRVYQGLLKKGATVTNVRTGKRVKVPRLVRMHSDEMEDVESIGAGEICAMFGVECSSGDTFSDLPGGGGYSMVSSAVSYLKLPTLTFLFVRLLCLYQNQSYHLLFDQKDRRHRISPELSIDSRKKIQHSEFTLTLNRKRLVIQFRLRLL